MSVSRLIFSLASPLTFTANQSLRTVHSLLGISGLPLLASSNAPEAPSPSQWNWLEPNKTHLFHFLLSPPCPPYLRFASFFSFSDRKEGFWMGFKECMDCVQSLPPPLISQKVHDLQNVKSHQLLITRGTCTGVSHSYRSVKYWVEKSSLHSSVGNTRSNES